MEFFHCPVVEISPLFTCVPLIYSYFPSFERNRDRERERGEEKKHFQIKITWLDL